MLTLPQNFLKIDLKRIGVPIHYQDTGVHCGLACAMMILDWLKRGARVARPPGAPANTMSQLFMHRWMHEHSHRDPTFWTSPRQLRMLINESAGNALPSAGIRAYDITGTPDGILARIDHELENGRPVVVHTASTADEGGHWVVVMGRLSWAPKQVRGYYVLDPWVGDTKHAYPENTDNYKGLCYENNAKSISTSYLHTRGNGCSCPQWRGYVNPAIGEQFVVSAAMRDRISWGAVALTGSETCHAVILSYPLRVPKVPDLRVGLKPIPLPHPVGGVSFGPEFRALVITRLKTHRIIGPRAPANWRRAFVDKDPELVPLRLPSSDAVLCIWPSTPEGSRIAAMFDRTGELESAVILKNWPIIRTSSGFARWFQRHAQRLCEGAGLAIDPKTADITVEPELFWKPSIHSTIPWWPFHVVQLSTVTGRKEKLYVDLGGRVYRSLPANKRMGG